MSLNQHTFAYSLNIIHPIDKKYIPIIETKIEKIFEADISSGNDIEDASIKKPKGGKGIVTVNGVSEISDFIDVSGDGSRYRIKALSCRIDIFDGGISFVSSHDDSPELHVKVEKILEVIKEENLPENILLKGDAVPVPSTAQIGQTIIVSAVDENGKPTEWEAVDVPINKKWELINNATLAEDSSSYTFTTDTNGEVFSLKNAVVFMRIRGNTSETTGWINLTASGEGTFRFTNIPSGFAATEGQDNYYTCKIAIDVNDIEVSAVAYKSNNNSSSKDNLGTFSGAGSSLINGTCPLTSITKIQLLCNGAALGANTEIYIYGVKA